MQALEKILEEIDEMIDEMIEGIKENPSSGDVDVCYGLNAAKKIIRKHMTDGWIPVGERLPEESLERVIGWDAHGESCCIVQCRNGRLELSNGEPVKIVAWGPLPEPYQPERSDNHDGE